MAKKTKRTTKKKATRQRGGSDPSSVVRPGELAAARRTTKKKATKKKATRTSRAADPASVVRQGEGQGDIAAARRRVRRANTIPAGLTTRRRELAEARRTRITAEQGGASQRTINRLKGLEERAATQVQRQRQAARNARRPTT